MDPVTINDFSLFLGVNFVVAGNGTKISHVEFFPVEPRSLAAKQGLLDHDKLIAIDGHEVQDLSKDAFEKLFVRTADKDGFLTWKFTIQRGLSKATSIIKFTVKAEEMHKPPAKK